MRLGLVITAALVLSCARALAQFDDPYGDPAQAEEAEIGPVSVRAGGILVTPVGESSERFQPGGGFTAGVTLSADTVVGLQLEYMFSHYGLRHDVLDLLSLEGYHQLHAFGVNLIVRPTVGLPFGLYFVGGPGVYQRSVSITHATGEGPRRFCDAFLLFCFPTEVPASEVLGSEQSADFGVSGGVGFYVMLAPPLRVYMEARVHYVWGPSFQSLGETIDSDTAYVPVVLGVAY